MCGGGLSCASLDAGAHFLIPFVDRPRPIVWRFNEVYLRFNKQEMSVHQSTITRIDLRETVLDFPNQASLPFLWPPPECIGHVWCHVHMLCHPVAGRSFTPIRAYAQLLFPSRCFTLIRIA